MSHKLIDLNPDLKRLRNEGYELEIKNSHLVVYHIPYVNSRKEISFGILVCPLGNMSGDRLNRPQNHTIYFTGEVPCDQNGVILKGILNSSAKRKLAEGIEVDHYFSAKPRSGHYENYYEKIVTYTNIISSQAKAIDCSVTARTYKVIEVTEQESSFNYLDTNSSRAEIEAISIKLKNLRIAIIGTGGTGSYVLDFVAKTPVKEIHLFDDDSLLSHNAFRTPGAVSIAILDQQPKKVNYLFNLYSNMHKNIVQHDYRLTSLNLDELSNMNFVFICIDEGEIKKLIIKQLTEHEIPFVDTGVGICAIDGLLTGSIRITTGTIDKHDHYDNRIPFSDDGHNDYDKNIQIAEINALNAALAVIKWKKIFGYYHDLEKEHHTIYNINCNQMVNDEKVEPSIR